MVASDQTWDASSRSPSRIPFHAGFFGVESRFLHFSATPCSGVSRLWVSDLKVCGAGDGGEYLLGSALRSYSNR